MSKPAVFEASYFNFEYKRGLKVCRLVFEVPYEAAGLVRDILGDPPGPGEQTNVAIARLMAAPVPAKSEPAEPASEKPKLRSNLAAILCKENRDFRGWLLDEYPDVWAAHRLTGQEPDHFMADQTMKDVLGIQSKAELDSNEEKAQAFDRLTTSFLYRNQVRA